jgi:hypothetical protein
MSRSSWECVGETSRDINIGNIGIGS